MTLNAHQIFRHTKQKLTQILWKTHDSHTFFRTCFRLKKATTSEILNLVNVNINLCVNDSFSTKSQLNQTNTHQQLLRYYNCSILIKQLINSTTINCDYHCILVFPFLHRFYLLHQSVLTQKSWKHLNTLHFISILLFILFC